MNIIRPAAATALILTVPFIMTQLGSRVDGDGWHWTLSDFMIIAVLIFGAGLLVELAVIKIKNKNHRIIAALIIVGLVVWIWAELAVGLFTNLGS